MNSKLVVGIIEPVGGHGGMNYYDMGLSLGLASNNVAVNWYTCDETNEESVPGVRIVKSFKSIYGCESRLFRLFRFVWGLILSYIDLKKQNGKIAHFHFFHLSMLELMTVLFAKLFLFKVIITIHDVESFSTDNNPMVSSLILKCAERLIVHNNVSRNCLSKMLNELNLNKEITIIPHGHYLDYINHLDKFDARTSIDLPTDRKILLFFGQIKSVKGLDVLLNSLKTVIEKNPDVLLVIAGKTWKNDFSYYNEIITRNGLSSHTRLDIRYIQDCEVANYYCAADFIILPYKKIFQSGVLLMAMSYGTPVITSDIPGMTEIVQNGFNGITFRSEDQNDLASTINNALNLNTQVVLDISQNALALMKSKHSWGLIGALTLLEYKSTLQNEG